MKDSAEIRAIREPELPGCLALWQTVFSGAPPHFFPRYFHGDAEWQPEYTRVAVMDGRIVSAVQIVKRVVSCGDFTLTMGGIANVATLPEYRGRGLSRRCLEDAITILEADAFDFSLLFTGIPPHYARLGWEQVAVGRLSGAIREDFAHRYTYGTVRHYEAGDDAAIHLIHAAFNRTRPITVRRSAPYWRDWIGWWRGAAPGKAIVAEDEGAVVGYALYEVRADRAEARVREIGVRDGTESAVRPLLETVAADGLRHGAREMHVPLHTEPAISAAAADLLDDVRVQPRSGTMVRFLSRDGLLRGLAPELTDRWMAAGSPPGSLTVTGPYGAARIAARGPGGFLTVEATDEAEGALNQAELFGLLAGQGVPDGRLPERDGRFAVALFPPFHPWYWELDGF